MRDGKIIVARIWPGYTGGVPSRMPVITGVNPEKYETVFVYLSKGSDEPNIFGQKGKKVFYLSEKSSISSFSLWSIFKLARLLKKENVDIVHCHKHKGAVHGVIAARLAKVPIRFSHVHGMGRSRGFRRKLLNRVVFRWVSKILTVGQAVREDVLKNNPSVKPDMVVSLGNSIDFDKFSNIIKQNDSENNSFVFATAGRLAETKGQVYLIRAFEKVKKRIPNTQLLIAGSGKLENALRQEAINCDCEKSVRFLGKIDDMLPFYGKVDVFVLPSIAEGLPRSLMEAMAAGVFCIGTKAGSVPEVLGDGEFGLVARAKDEGSLAKAMVESAEMAKNRREKIIASAKRHIYENYSHGVIIKRLEKIYGDETKSLDNNSQL